MEPEDINATITQYIENVLQRAPEDGEVESYAALVDSGNATLEDIQSNIINSAEAVNDVYPVILTYQAIYGRVPDASGLDYWTDVYRANMDLDNPATDNVDEGLVAVLKAFVDADTPEFVARYGADPTGDQFVAAAYQNVLNRTPDEGGLNYWQERYAQIEASYEGSGMSQDEIDTQVRAQVLEQFVSSAEYEDATSEEVDIYLMDRAEGETPTGSLFDFDPAANVGQTFTLTDGSDTIQGNPGNLTGSEGTVDNSQDDTIIAGLSSVGGMTTNNLGSGDIVDGGDGFDTLRVIDEGSTLTPNMSNVERINVQALNGTTTMNMINVVGAEQLWSANSTDDAAFTNIQENATIGISGSDNTVEATFDDGVDLGGEVSIAADDAGTDAMNMATVLVNAADADNVDTINVMAVGGASFLAIDVDDAAAPVNGDSAQPEALMISGEGDLFLREANPGGDGAGNAEFDALTAIDSTGLEGSLDLDLSGNDEDFVFTGGDGDTTLDASGTGDVDITTGAGDDDVDASGTGDVTVTTGAGDDGVSLGAEATAADTADGGEGVDTIGVDAGTLDGLTGDDVFEGSISGFEQVHVEGAVAEGDTVTVDLDNLDDIDYVISDGTDAGTAVAEAQRVAFNPTGDFGGQVTIEGVEIDLAANLNDSEVPQYILDNFEDQIIAAYNGNHPGEVMTDVYMDSSLPDHLYFDFEELSGDVPLISVTSNTGTLSAGATFGSGTADTPGTDPVDEVQTLDFTTAPDTDGDITITFDPAGSSGIAGDTVVVQVLDGETTVETATRVANAVSGATGVESVTTTGDGSVVEITFDSDLDDINQLTFAAGTTNAAATAATDTQGAAAVQEEQTFAVTSGTDADGGFIHVELSGSAGAGSVDIEVDPDLTPDELGFAIQSHASEITSAIPELASVNYDTSTDELTFTSTLAAGDIDPISIGNTAGNFPDVVEHFDEFDGVDGSADGILNLDYTAPGGTLELVDENNGVTNVNVAGTSGASDAFNIVLAEGAGDHDGVVSIAGIESLSVTSEDTVQVNLGLDAPDAESLTVQGTGGVNFINDFTNLTSLDASGVTDLETGADGDVEVVTTTAEDANFVGGDGDDYLETGAGDDTIDGGAGGDELVGNAGMDTLLGGDGSDDIVGGLDADTLTGGADDDFFYFAQAEDSQGTTVDTITDFTSGEDALDFTDFNGGAGLAGGSYAGSANGYGAVLTSLSSGGAAEAVLDTSTSTLYVDVNGDGVLNDNDMAIGLTGVTALADTDFHWS